MEASPAAGAHSASPSGGDPAGVDDTVSDSSERWQPITLESVLADSTQRLTDFLLSNIDLQPWEPPTAWNGLPARAINDLERARSLSMLRMSGSSQEHYFPDMLLYALGEPGTLDPDYPARQADLLSGDDHIYLCNASGTGKTRLLFETLARHWGFYLTCAYHRISDPYGSADLDTALSDFDHKHLLGRALNSELPFSGKGSRDFHAELKQNRYMASRVFSGVIFSRLFFLDHFWAICTKLGIADATARRKWLFVQLRPTELVYSDVFLRLNDFAENFSDEELAQRIEKLYKAHKSRISFVALDEAQVALNMCPRAFTRGTGRRPAAVFREVVAALAANLPDARMIVAGTELDLGLMSDALRGSGPRHKGVRFFHDLGCFRSKERVRGYLAHFLGATVAARHDGLVHRWLQGRHRLVALVVMCTLMAGDDQLETVVNTLVFKLTEYKCLPSRAVIDAIRIPTAIPDKKFESYPHARVLRDAVLSYAHTSQTSLLSSAADSLVTLGVALYPDDPTQAEIFEPFIFLTLCRWLIRSPLFGIHGLIQQRLSDDSLPVHGFLFLRGLAMCIAQTVNSPDSPMHEYLRFSGAKPRWARQSASLVLPRLVEDRLHFIELAGDAVGPTPMPLRRAADPAEVLAWFSGAENPFLIPDSDFGASMLCFVQLADSGLVVLLCFRLPASRRSKRDRRYVPYDPDDFYRKVPETAQSLRTILHTLPALPIFTASGRRAKPARFSLIHVLCFADAYDDDVHDPPIARLCFHRVLADPAPSEIQFSDVVAVASRDPVI